MTISLLLEICASLSSIVYSLLLMREKIAGWYFGILASVLSIILFYHTRLYAQSLISIYYAGVGVYGLIYWIRAKQRHEHIHRWNAMSHIKFIALFTLISCITYFLMKTYTDASSPMLDAFLTAFGLLASIKEARKILSSWVYWFIINLGSAWLYYSQDLTVYAILMVVYAGICIPGYLSWLKIYKTHPVVTA
ncbi:MAG: nicotinamide riboside transporter PnuC [Bacteroidia bacterium]|jgi:nicotinamide mononucleotide transporter